MRLLKFFATAAAGFALASAAYGQELKIGLSAEPSAMDPHFHKLAPNHELTKHIFDALTDQDENQRLKPGLAASWRTVLAAGDAEQGQRARLQQLRRLLKPGARRAHRQGACDDR
jgi:ABC-type transport system substrate-binding protein